MQGSNKHRPYPFEDEDITLKEKRDKKREMRREHRRKERDEIRKVSSDDDQDFQEPDVGYKYIT